MTHSFQPCGMVTLTTDFGGSDGYVGALKGVILSTDSRLRIIDIGHFVPPQSVVHGTLAAAAACPRFPVGVVHLVVVDPGVGSDRAPVAIVAGGHCFVGPDNGVLGEAVEQLGGVDMAVRIEREFGPISPTFHGRDIFAPAAAALAAGRLTLSQLGPPHEPVRINFPAPKRVPEGFIIRVLAWDHFGNCLTNMTLADGPLPRMVMLQDATKLPICRTYAEVPVGSALALVSSMGFLEIAVRNGSAAEELQLQPGDTLLALT